MKKLKKILIIFIMALVVIVVGGTIALRIAFPPAKIKGILITKMSEFLHREIEIQSVSVGLSGLEVKGFKVSDKPTFKNGTFVEADQFTIRPDLFALLQKKISISKIILSSPKINIVRNKDNSFNFSDLMVMGSTGTKKKEVTKEVKLEALPVAFIVSKFAITNGDVKFIDKTPQNMSTELKNINVSLVGISLVSPFLVDLSVDVLQNKINASISLSFSGVVNINQQNVKIKEAIVKVAGAGIKVSGNVDKFMDPQKLMFAVNIKGEKLALEKLSKLAFLPKEFSISGEPNINIDISGTVDKIQVKGSIDAKKIETSFGDMFSKPKDTDMYLTTDIVLEKMDVLKINDLSMAIGNIKTGMSGKVVGISPKGSVRTNNKIVMDIKILLEKFDLKSVAQIVPIAKELGISGAVGGEAKISGELKQIAVSGKVRIQNVQSIQKDMSAKVSKGDLDFSVMLSDLKKTNITFNLDGDTIDIKTAVTAVQSAKEQSQSKVQSTKVPITSEQSTNVSGGIPKDITITGDVKLKKFIFQNYQISDCSAKIELANAILNIKPFSMTMCKGSIAGSISADLSDLDPTRLRFNFTTDVKNYDIHELLLQTGVKLKAQVWGVAEGKVKISGSGSDMSKLNGNGSLLIKNMKISNFKILDKLATIAMMPQLKETSFKTVTGGFNITNGKIELSNTKTDGGDKLDAYCSGDANLVSKTQDIKGDIKFTKEYSTGDLAKYTADSEGRVTVPFIISGPFDDPKVALNYAKIAKTAATKALLQEGGKALLKGLFGK